MNKTKILVGLCMMILLVSTVFAFTYDSSYDKSDSNYGLPGVVEYNSDNILIMYDTSSDNIHGYVYNGSEWVSNSSLTTGLTAASLDSTMYFSPFVINNTLHGIVSTYLTGRYGFTFNGTQWISNSSVMSGLHSAYIYEYAFIEGEQLFSFSELGTPKTYNWNYSSNSWTRNTSYEVGLPVSTDIGWQFFSPYYYNETYYALYSQYNGTFTGYSYNGSSWVIDDAAKTGLNYTTSSSNPSVYDFIEIGDDLVAVYGRVGLDFTTYSKSLILSDPCVYSGTGDYTVTTSCSLATETINGDIIVDGGSLTITGTVSKNNVFVKNGGSLHVSGGSLI